MLTLFITMVASTNLVFVANPTLLIQDNTSAAGEGEVGGWGNIREEFWVKRIKGGRS